MKNKYLEVSKFQPNEKHLIIPKARKLQRELSPALPTPSASCPPLVRRCPVYEHSYNVAHRTILGRI